MNEDLRKLKEEQLRRCYRRDPALYARQVLGVTWWEKQIEIAEALRTYRRVFVKASHAIGKSFLAGGLINWFFDGFDPGVCITTAPTQLQVEDVLWKEVRMQRKGRPGLQPKAPRMETSDAHFAVGMTARSDSAFQGRHAEHVLIVFDECVGVESPFWDGAEGMMTSKHTFWLCLCNPTDTGSRAYRECLNTQKWHVIEVSALQHPNIAAGLAGLPLPFPGAVELGWVEGRIKEWCSPIPVSDRRAGDLEFPPGSNLWHRPGALFESRVLGRWPTQGSASVWTEAMWLRCMEAPAPVLSEPLVIGCDKARFGDDFTSIVVRRGNCALHHETHNGWDNNQIAGRLKQLCAAYALPGQNPKQVPCLIDDVQGSVIDLAGGFHFVGVNSAERAQDESGYPNRRSELWFATAERADSGRLDLSRLSPESRTVLRAQVMAPLWKVDSQGRRVVEPKADTKKRLKRSPDDADALNLAFYGAANWSQAAEALKRAPRSPAAEPGLW